MVSLKNMLRVGYNYVRSIWSNPALHSTLHSANTNAGFIKGYGAQNVARYDISENAITQAIRPATRFGVDRNKSINAGQGIQSGRTNVVDDREVRKVENLANSMRMNPPRYSIQNAERYGMPAIVLIDKNDVPISEDTQMELEVGRKWYANAQVDRSFLGRVLDKLINWLRGK